ncbi:MAG: hypothetical protein O2819_09460, partial [Planctomycetota bacterium]|nr:hypothetical protein [Planctomycetota bacterium]
MIPTAGIASDAVAAIRRIAFAALLAALPACQARNTIRDYPGVPAEQVWRAALAAAEDPLPGKWHMIENGVWADEAERRIELHRVLRRDVFEVGASSPYREERDWAVSIRVLDPASGERRFAVAVEIEDRTLAYPRKFHAFTDLFFDDVERRLTHMPRTPVTAGSAGGLLAPDATYRPAPAPAPAPASEPEPAPASEP